MIALSVIILIAAVFRFHYSIKREFRRNRMSSDVNDIRDELQRINDKLDRLSSHLNKSLDNESV